MRFFCADSTNIKILFPCTPLIPCPLPPRDERETTERTPTQLPMSKKCVLLRFPFSKP